VTRDPLREETIESLISAVTVLLVAARAINILR
jgi:hypothetical protein